MSPSEVVKQPSSCVSAADPAICFFGLVTEFGSEAAVGTALWATERTGASNPSMHSMRPQTDLTLDLPWNVNVVMFLFAALLLCVFRTRFARRCSLLQFLCLLRGSDEPFNEVIVRLLHAGVAGIVVHTGMVHFQVQLRNVVAQVIEILVLLKVLD